MPSQLNERNFDMKIMECGILPTQNIDDILKKLEHSKLSRDKVLEIYRLILVG